MKLDMIVWTIAALIAALAFAEACWVRSKRIDLGPNDAVPELYAEGAKARGDRRCCYPDGIMRPRTWLAHGLLFGGTVVFSYYFLTRPGVHLIVWTEFMLGSLLVLLIGGLVLMIILDHQIWRILSKKEEP